MRRPDNGLSPVSKEKSRHASISKAMSCHALKHAQSELPRSPIHLCASHNGSRRLYGRGVGPARRGPEAARDACRRRRARRLRSFLWRALQISSDRLELRARDLLTAWRLPWRMVSDVWTVTDRGRRLPLRHAYFLRLGRRHTQRSLRGGDFLEHGFRPLRQMQSGHPGDYVLWITIGLAIFGSATMLFMRT